jgi:hypothetical protein
MEACELVRLIVNKAIVPAEPTRRGNPGYGRVKALRVLVYARLKGLNNDTRVIEYLKKHIEVSRKLGLFRVPIRSTVDRWWRRYLSLLEETFIKIADMLQLMEPTTAVIVDSTPLVDLLRHGGKMGTYRQRKIQRLQAPCSRKPVWFTIEGNSYARQLLRFTVSSKTH